MNLSELKPTEKIKLLVYGNSGSGKTCLAAGFPTPILYFDFDGKIGSAATFHKKDKERLKNIEVIDCSKQLDDVDPMEELQKIIRERLIPQQKTGKMEFDTLVIDSITTFSAATLAHIIRTNPGIKRFASKQGVQPGMQDYGILKREFAKIIPGLISLPCNVVMLAHIKTNKDELTGEIIRGPLMDGSFAEQLAIYFNEVWRSYVERDKYLAQTKADHRFDCATRLGLPNPIKLEYNSILN